MKPAAGVRIIGGHLKRSRLPVADKPGLRPTPDRVRETLFNWLGQDLGGARVLDAFAGSGALGFEAASRGAADVLLLEHDGVLVRSLRETQQRLQATTLRVEQGDALAWMARCERARFDIVFIDPPFGQGLHARAIDVAIPLLAEHGQLYVEAAEPLATLPDTVEIVRQARAGAVHFHLLRQRR